MKKVSISIAIISICVILILLLASPSQGFTGNSVRVQGGSQFPYNIQEDRDEGIPRDLKVIDEISIRACPGETASATFWLRSKSGSLSPRFNARGVRGTIQLFQCRDAYVARLKRRMPFYLCPPGDRSLNGKPVLYWLDYTPPSNLPPGKFEGCLDILDGIRKIGQIKLKVEILPIELDPSDIAFGMYYDSGRNPQGFNDIGQEKKFMTDMKNHGMNLLTVYRYPEKCGENGEKLVDIENDFRVNSGMEKFIDTAKEIGLVKEDMPLLFLTVGPGGKSFGDLTSKTVERLTEIAAEKNWPRLIFYVSDEPVDNTKAEIFSKIYYSTFHPLKNCPWLTTALATKAIPYVLDQETGTTIGDVLDLWIFNAGYVRYLPEIMKLADSKKKEVWFYDCRADQADPSRIRYYSGWLNQKTGVKGNLMWVYINYSELSQNLPDKAPDQGMVIPTSNRIIPFIRWQARRDGTFDYRYLSTLKRMISLAREKGHKQIAEKWEKNVKNMLEGFPLALDHLKADSFRKSRNKIVEGILEIRESLKQDSPALKSSCSKD